MFIAEVRAHHTAAPQPPLVTGALRIKFKLATVVFRCLHGTAPQYLAHELRCVANTHLQLRLHSAPTLALNSPPMCHVTISDRTFGVGGLVCGTAQNAAVLR